eukprot:COSAG05_NODE_97_length_19444_cov_8.577174_17_plen_107_part_00
MSRGRYRKAGLRDIRSNITGVTPAGLAVLEAALPLASQGGEWKLCYDSRVHCVSCPSSHADYGGHACNCAPEEPSFHGNCDRYNQTLVRPTRGLPGICHIPRGRVS